MTQTIEQLAVEIGELLAASPLDEKTKRVILENIDTMPEDMVFRLHAALQNERDEIDSVLFDLELLLNEQDKNWAKVEDDQAKVAKDIGDQLFERLKDQ